MKIGKLKFGLKILLLLLNFEVVAQHSYDADTVLEKRYNYNTLSSYQKLIFDEFVDAEFPAGKSIQENLSGNISTRAKIRLAEALFFRNHSGDVENANAIVQWICKLQNVEKGSINFGVWPGGNGITNIYDQNMREFIGTDLLIIYDRYKQQLSSETLNQVVFALIQAAKGAYKRNVDPNYNNISIMSSLMMEYVGHTFHLKNIEKAGLKKANKIYRNYHKYNAFCEFNTPTYYGVDFAGLAMWRTFSFSQDMQTMGRHLEKDLWNDVATFYNPNLQNMCGPFFRGYGMDMQKYNAITGIWIAAAIDNPKIASIPLKNGGKFYECGFIVSILEMGIDMPQTVLKKLEKFDKPIFISKTVPNYYEGNKLKQVTAMVNENWMMGGIWGCYKLSKILRIGTIHWKAPNGSISWLLLPGEGKTNVKVDEKNMEIYLADKKASSFIVYVYSTEVNQFEVNDSIWQFPKMKFTIATTLIGKMSREQKDPNIDFTEEVIDKSKLIKLEYAIPPNFDKKNPLLIISPIEN
jgi:hypothetical protein